MEKCSEKVKRISPHIVKALNSKANLVVKALGKSCSGRGNAVITTQLLQRVAKRKVKPRIYLGQGDGGLIFIRSVDRVVIQSRVRGL